MSLRYWQSYYLMVIESLKLIDNVRQTHRHTHKHTQGGDLSVLHANTHTNMYTQTKLLCLISNVGYSK